MPSSKPSAARSRGALRTPSFELIHHTLGNGLRVVLAPDRAAPVVGIAVLYDVGFRSEPEGRTGFAHLFEHLMFQGSANLEKLEHFRYVQASGGIFNGSTHLDYTNYFEVLPSNAFERGLFLEADRMRSPRITEENLANQISVVKEEIRVNVMNRPYGGFPWLVLPPLLYDTFPNAHNGYGGFEDLQNATVADASAFFDSYYAPANAVLSVAGDFDPDTALELIESHFGGIRRRKKPARPDFSEPPLTADRRDQVTDQLAPLPAVALGYRLTDPNGDLRQFLATVLLSEILSDGDASRLQRSLVQKQRLVTDISAYLGTFGDPLEERNPTRLNITAHYANAKSTDAVLAAVDGELDRLATRGTEPGEIDRVRTKLSATVFRELDQVLNRSLEFAKFELLFDRASLSLGLPVLLAEITDDDIRAAAARLVDSHRAVVELLPGGDK
ncbi:insulinase family protein [Jatrophihabitans telluris]|uniref:Insulinase family protein n=1 Tax=Jatrophihabitans telluris TaxID=2038343 RepID=A0ABY4R1Q0_9ACTN|nr:pitrilysin family protein [Jatrophihabitans telluris]UQX89723.1 insulinase family protein [Jatrophihabitans telluris]